MKVFVSDAHSRATLQIVRSLGSKGIEVYSGEKFKITPTYFSRYLSGYIVYKDPAKYPKEFVKQLNKYCNENEINVIIPVVDHSYYALSKYGEYISPEISIPIVDYQKFLKARDKLYTMNICEKLNIPHPKTYFTKELDINDIKKEFELPVVLKPRMSSGSRGIKLINSWSQLEKAFKEVSKEYGTPMIQEFIPHGGAYGVEMLYNKGKMLLSFSHKRLREFPPSGGPSTLRVSVRRKDLEEIAKKILDNLEWHGVAMVEFRIHRDKGIPYVMEINPRYWGSLRLTIAAGLDIPYAHYQLALGKDITIENRYKSGVMARWLFWGDILWLFTSSEENKIKEFFISFRRKVYYDILTGNDPLPLMGALLEAIHLYRNEKMRKYAMERGL